MDRRCNDQLTGTDRIFILSAAKYFAKLSGGKLLLTFQIVQEEKVLLVGDLWILCRRKSSIYAAKTKYMF